MKITAVVKAGARKESIEKTGERCFKVSVKEVPEKGKANAAAIKILARFLRVPASAVKLLFGASSRKKIFEVNV